MPKHYINQNIYYSAKERIKEIFQVFPKVYLAFSGGKDSTVMLHLALDVAKSMDRLPLDVLFVDLEGQYKMTIDHIKETIINNPDFNVHWVCLPLNLRNSVSTHQPHWRCWDDSEKPNWIRPLPQYKGVISDLDYYPFYKYGMEFEDFVYKWGKWFAQDSDCTCLLGIRADESLNRFVSVTSNGWKGKNWMSRATDNLVFSYPIYDWKTEDIWKYVGKERVPYNKLYDYFHLCGISIHQMRICQPYGDDQRQSLEYFQKIEPDTWNNLLKRVKGAHFGAIYSKTAVLGRRKIIKPEGITWKKYAKILLMTLPEITRTHYVKKIKTFFMWWNDNGFPMELIPDEGNLKLENSGKQPVV